MTETRTELLEQNLVKLMFKLSIPAIIGMLVIGLYSFMDAVFVGQMIGAKAMGAISVVYPFTMINSGIATLIGIGSASVLSRAIGKKDTPTVDKIMGNLAALVSILSIIATIVVLIFSRKLLAITGAKGEILELAVRYLRVVFIGSIFVNFAQSANMLMRAEGLMKKAMTFMVLGAIANIVLDPMLILAMGERGIEGAAIATLLSQVIQSVVTLFYFLKKSEVVRFHGIKIAVELLPEIFSVGVSAMLMQVLFFIQQTVLYNIASRYGGAAQIILIGASQRILAFSFIPLWGMSQGLQPVAGTNFGAGLYTRVKQSANLFMLGATILALCFWIPIQLAPATMLAMFIKDQALVEQGVSYFRLMYSIFPANGVLIMALTFFQALGQGAKASVLIVLRQIGLFVPLVILLPRLMKIYGVWGSLPLADGMVFLLSIVMLTREYRRMGRTKLGREVA
jgi:putative MATE family efflux protein